MSASLVLEGWYNGIVSGVMFTLKTLWLCCFGGFWFGLWVVVGLAWFPGFLWVFSDFRGYRVCMNCGFLGD